MNNKKTKKELEIELEETQEALSRSRQLRRSLTSQFDPTLPVSLEERARRLLIECMRVPTDYQFDSEGEKEYWMEKYIKLGS